MNLIKQKDGTISLNTSVEDMQKIICAMSYIQGTSFDFLWDHVDYDSPLHPENCVDILTQVVEEVDLIDGNIKIQVGFKVVEKE